MAVFFKEYLPAIPKIIEVVLNSPLYFISLIVDFFK